MTYCPIYSLSFQVPVLTQWRGQFCVKLNISNPEAVSWFLDRVGLLQARLGMESIHLEGAEGNLMDLGGGDQYIGQLADVAARIEESAIMNAGTR